MSTAASLGVVSLAGVANSTVPPWVYFRRAIRRRFHRVYSKRSTR